MENNAKAHEEKLYARRVQKKLDALKDFGELILDQVSAGEQTPSDLHS